MKLCDEEIGAISVACGDSNSRKAIRQLKEERDRHKEALLHIINDPCTSGYARAIAKQALGEDDAR